MTAAELPKLYRVVTIVFSSLRNGLGSSMGVVFDIDTVVRRRARRVLRSDNSWFWQIENVYQLGERDHYAWADQEILNEYSSERLGGIIEWKP